MFKRIFRCLVLFIIISFSICSFAVPKALVLEVKGPIGPATQDYIARGIDDAIADRAVLIILEMDTPGGLETSMRGIIDNIIKSPIPVVTFVTPDGARATSAGTFILYASHFAYMAPHTQVGAASPVSFSPSENKSKEMSTLEKKAMNDAVSYIKNLARKNNRNEIWAELAVRQGASITAQEAKQQKVINDIATNYPDLLQKIHLKQVNVGGVSKTIDTKNLVLQKNEPDWHYRFLAFITDPNIAYILMLIAAYGIFFELSNPGLILPGVVGLIALFLMLYAFQLMPVNYAGLALMICGIAFMILEIYVSSFGVLGIGGVIAFILGSILLFDWRNPHLHVDWLLIFAMSIISAGFFLLVTSLAISSYKRKVITGTEALIGSTGTVLNVTNGKLIVQISGEIWEAKSSASLEIGDRIKVVDAIGLKLRVEPIQNK